MNFPRVFSVALGFLAFPVISLAEVPDYQRAKHDPIHFAPSIYTATDAQCLSCHREVLEASVRASSPAGVPSSDALAWYQTLDTYEGPQETFHRRHLLTPYATSLMQMSCNTCHRGNEPRDEMQSTPPQQNGSLTLRKMVDPNLCAQCHSPMNFQVMGLPSPWEQSGNIFGNNCLTCHATIRTTRHQVNYLKPDAIETAAKEKGADVCYGCHGGRAWYQKVFPYPRHAWAGMSEEVPTWARERPTESPEYVRMSAKAKMK